VSDGQVFILGPQGQMVKMEGQIGTTPDCPEARFAKRAIVRVRRLKHLIHLPELGAVVAVVPPGFSADWAWADVCGKPRPLMHQVPARKVKYIIGFQGDYRPHLMRERDLLPTREPEADIIFSS
jgi:hypothetical protein